MISGNLVLLVGILALAAVLIYGAREPKIKRIEGDVSAQGGDIEKFRQQVSRMKLEVEGMQNEVMKFKNKLVPKKLLVGPINLNLTYEPKKNLGKRKR